MGDEVSTARVSGWNKAASWFKGDSLIHPLTRMVVTSSAASRLWMGFVVNLDQLFHRHMRVYLRRGKPRVAQQLLDIAQIGAAVEQVRRE